MRWYPVLLPCCAFVLVSCAQPIAVKVSTAPIQGVELTLNRTEAGGTQISSETKPMTGVSDCVFENVSQERDLTIVARKEGYQVASVTIPAVSEEISYDFLWSPKEWSNLLWSAFGSRSQYLKFEDENHREIDLETEGVTIELTPVSAGDSYKPTPLPPFEASMMKGF